MKTKLINKIVSIMLIFLPIIQVGGLQMVSSTSSEEKAPTSELAGIKAVSEYEERLTPIMGWASWNEYGARITQDILYSQMDAMVEHGLVDVGYGFFNIDDGFQGGRSKETGLVVNNPEKFPDGMKAIADYAHARNMKAGIYTDAGQNTCASVANQNPDLEWQATGYGLDCGLYGDGTGETNDVKDLRQYFVDWGYDFIKVDWCGGTRQKLSQQTRYTTIGQEIEKLCVELGKDLIYNICSWSFPGAWVLNSGADSWRTGGDIHATFADVMVQVDRIKSLAQYTGPGHVNDLDMMQVGRGMSYDEDKAHFSMWCMMSTPLMIGCDLTKISEETLSILKNEEMIAINQDPACLQATVAKTISHTGGNTEIWSKDLGEKDSSTKAIAILNRSSSAQEVIVDWSELGFAGDVLVRDLWQHKYLQGADTSYTVNIPSHGIVVLKVTGSQVETELVSSLQSNLSDKSAEVNLADAGDIDWAYPAASAFKSGTNVIGNFQYTGTQSAYDNATTAYSWTGGKGTETGTAVTQGKKVSGADASYSFTVPSARAKRSLLVYLGAEDAKIRIDAIIGNKQITDYMDGTGLYKLTYSSEDSLPLDITVSVDEIGGTAPAVLLEAIVLTTHGSGGEVMAEVALTDKPTKMDLTELGTGDWLHYGNYEGVNPNRKADVEEQIKYTGQVEEANYADSSTTYSWSDGASVKTCTGTKLGMNAGRGVGASAQIEVPSDSRERTLYLPISGWRSTVRLEVILDGNTIKDYEIAPHYKQGTETENIRVNKFLTVKYSAPTAGKLIVKWTVIATHNNDRGNIAMEGVALTAVEGPATGATTLSGSYQTLSDASINLESEGTVDYVSFGGNKGSILARKLGANVIGTYAKSEGATVLSADSPNTYTWTGGDSNKGAAQTGLNNYFEVILPASESLKKVNMYFGVKNADVRISATLGSQSYSTNVYDVSDGTANVVTLWYQGTNSLTINLKLAGSFAEDFELRLDAITLDENGNNIVLYPELSQEDDSLTVKNKLIKNSDTGYGTANVAVEVYNEAGTQVGDTVSVPVSLNEIGKIYEAVNKVTLPNSSFMGAVKVRILDDNGNALNDDFVFNLPLVDHEDHGYIGGVGAKAKVKAGAILIDVRTAAEFAAGNALPGAINIPHTLILSEPDEKLPADKNKEIIVYCSAGKRSAQAKKLLNDLGYANVYNLGGFEAWDENLIISMTGYDSVVMPGSTIAMSVAGSEPDILEIRYSIGKDSTIDDAIVYTAPVPLVSDKLNQIQVVKAYILFDGEVVDQAQRAYYVFSNPDIPSLSGMVVQYCSDMTPVKAVVQYKEVGNDCTIDEPNAKITLVGKAFDKGISAHAASEVTYAIPAGSTRFVAVAGCDDDIGSDRNIADITYRIYIDGVLVEQANMGARLYYIFDVEVPDGAKEIRLFARPTKTLSNSWMHSSWGIAGFVTNPDFVSADFSELDAALDAVEELNEEDYTEASWKILADSVASANALNRSTMSASSQDEIINITDAIEDAIEALVSKVPDSNILGDINEDGKITVSDIVMLRAIIMNDLTATEKQKIAGNVDGSTDGALTVSDIVALRKLIMSD